VPGRTPLGRISERFDVRAVRQIEHAWVCAHSSSPGRSPPEVERPTRNSQTATVRSSCRRHYHPASAAPARAAETQNDARSPAVIVRP
jgi:hypothetical protein